jgi:hypothetical protein
MKRLANPDSEKMRPRLNMALSKLKVNPCVTIPAARNMSPNVKNFFPKESRSNLSTLKKKRARLKVE